MDNKEYQLALEAADKKIISFKQIIPDDIRQREESLFESMSRSGHDRLSSLEFLFSEMDAIYNFIRQFSICQKGCSYCCQLGIYISPLEVEYINDKAEISKEMINTTDSKCIFLTGGICAIYDYRPFTCRRHLAFYESPAWCKLDISPDHRFPNIDCTQIDKCYEYLIGTEGRDLMKDIRQAFAFPGLEGCPPA